MGYGGGVGVGGGGGCGDRSIADTLFKYVQNVQREQVTTTLKLVFMLELHLVL